MPSILKLFQNPYNLQPHLIADFSHETKRQSLLNTGIQHRQSCIASLLGPTRCIPLRNIACLSSPMQFTVLEASTFFHLFFGQVWYLDPLPERHQSIYHTYFSSNFNINRQYGFSFARSTETQGSNTGPQPRVLQAEE